MNAIEEIKAKLQKYPQATYEYSGNCIRVLPATQKGFTVELFDQKVRYEVYFNGWHEYFTDKEEALNCFAFGLSTDCRLKVFRRGSFEYKWTFEYNDEGEWIEDSTTGLFFTPFWRRKQIVYLQNDLISG